MQHLTPLSFIRWIWQVISTDRALKKKIRKKQGLLCNRVPHTVLELLLLAGIPAGNVLQVLVTRLIWTTSCEPHSGQTGLPQSGQYLYPGDHLVGAVTVVKRAHDLELGLPAVRAWVLVHDEMAGMALVFPLRFRDIFEFRVFFRNFPLVCAPIHTTTSHKSLKNF